MSTSTLANDVTRDTLLSEIHDLENRLFLLRSQLDNTCPLKSVFTFRCRPQQFCHVYATCHKEALAKATAWMNKLYPGRWEFANQSVKVYAPEEAALVAADNLFKTLPIDDAMELLADMKTLRDAQGDTRRKPGEVPTQPSRLQRDAENFEIAQRMKEAR